MSASAATAHAHSFWGHTHTATPSGVPMAFTQSWQCTQCQQQVPMGTSHVCPNQWAGTTTGINTTIGTYPGSGGYAQAVLCSGCGQYVSSMSYHDCPSLKMYPNQQARLDALERTVANLVGLVNNLSTQLAEIQGLLLRAGVRSIVQ